MNFDPNNQVSHLLRDREQRKRRPEVCSPVAVTVDKISGKGHVQGERVSQALTAETATWTEN